MIVSELISELQKAPHDAHVVVGGEIIVTTTIITGRSAEGYYNRVFNETSNGRETAVVFLKHSENSKGEVGLSRG